MYSAGGGATWAEPRCAIDAADYLGDGQNRTELKMMQPCFLNLIRRGWNPGGNPGMCSAYGPKSKAYPSGVVANCTLPRYIENVKEHLEPGRFYHDAAANRVLYAPLAGQNMARATAVLAVEEQLVQLSGASRHSFDGIAFEHATWLRPGQGPGYAGNGPLNRPCAPHVRRQCGRPKHLMVALISFPFLSPLFWGFLVPRYVEAQAGACDLCPSSGSPGCTSPDYAGSYESLTPGNVAVTNGSRDIEFLDCGFRHLGAAATSSEGGSQKIAWRRCQFEDVSAGAVVLGDVIDSGPRSDANSSTPRERWDMDLTVEDSTIANLPVEYSGATAIFVGYVAAVRTSTRWSLSARISNPLLSLDFSLADSLVLPVARSIAGTNSVQLHCQHERQRHRGRVGLGERRLRPRGQPHCRQPHRECRARAMLRSWRHLHPRTAAPQHHPSQPHRAAGNALDGILSKLFRWQRK